MSVRERKERERLARRETILAAAAQVFAAHGVDGATVEMVARQAEVAVGTIYLYFSSRDDSFVSLMAERIGGLRARYLEIHARGLKPLDELRAIGHAYFDYLRESRGLFLAQLSVTFSKLSLRLSRDVELEHFEQVRRLGECFNLYRDSVKRWLSATGARTSSADATRAATVILGRAQRRVPADGRRENFPRHNRARGVAAARGNLRVPASRGRGRRRHAAAPLKRWRKQVVSAARARPAQRQEPTRRSFRGLTQRSGGAHDAGASERLAIG